MRKIIEIVKNLLNIKFCLGLPDPRPYLIKLLVGNIHYLHFGILLFFFTLAVTYGISYMGAPIPSQYVREGKGLFNFTYQFKSNEI